MIPKYIKTNIINKFFELDFISNDNKTNNDVSFYDFNEYFEELKSSSKFNDDLYETLLQPEINKDDNLDIKNDIEVN